MLRRAHACLAALAAAAAAPCAAAATAGSESSVSVAAAARLLQSTQEQPVAAPRAQISRGNELSPLDWDRKFDYIVRVHPFADGTVSPRFWTGVVSAEYVLTAASSTSPGVSEYAVKFTASLERAKFGMVHPKFNCIWSAEPCQYDFMVLYLARASRLRTPMMLSHVCPHIGQALVAAGFGEHRPRNSSDPEALQVPALPVLSRDVTVNRCHESTARCFSGIHQEGPCRGDAGGPWMVLPSGRRLLDGDQAKIVAGIQATTGHPRDVQPGCGLPGVHVFGCVASARPWLDAVCPGAFWWTADNLETAVPSRSSVFQGTGDKSM